MDRKLLKTGTRLVGVAVVSVVPLFSWAGCSLVVDTDECRTDADCEYADETQFECVAKECVPVAESVNRQALMPSVIEQDLDISGPAVWVIEGDVVVKPGASLTIERHTEVIVRPAAALHLCEDAAFAIHADHAELESIVDVTSTAGECQ